jgi:hypothetical protein
MRLKAAIFTLAAVGMLPLSAHAEPNAKAPLQVLNLEWEGDAEAQSEALFRALGLRVRESAGYSLGEVRASPTVLATSLECKDGIIDAACEPKVLAQLKSERFIWGTLTRKKGSPTVGVELHLVQKGFASVVVRETFSAQLSETYDKATQAFADKLMKALTQSPEAKGALSVKTGAVECEIAVDGVRAGASSKGLFQVSTSSAVHVVETLAPCEPLLTRVFVPAGGTGYVDFGKSAIPEEGPSLRKPLAIAVIAAGAVVGVGLGGFFFGGKYFSNRSLADERWTLEAFDTPSLDCSNVGQKAKATGTCGAVSAAERNGNYALVFGGLGLAMVGAGAVLLVTGGKHEPAEKSQQKSARTLQVSPMLGTVNGALVMGKF